MESATTMDQDSLLLILDYAFQPVVNIHTGLVYGFGAFIRNVDKAGYGPIADFFNSMHQLGVLADYRQKLYSVN
jgi:EAL domain-containing protein (putative c-di-GMP-specific phosphodiesterase class I)